MCYCKNELFKIFRKWEIKELKIKKLKVNKQKVRK